jgi:hypothetical protein
MDLKTHILTALSEQIETYTTWIAWMDDQKAAIALSPSVWDSRDVLTHCWFWQQRSNERMAAAVESREPVFIRLPAGMQYNREEDIDAVNAWSAAEFRESDWQRAWQRWQQGYKHLLETAAKIPQAALLDSGRYPWMNGYPLMNVLLGTYDHHVEHMDELNKFFHQK